MNPIHPNSNVIFFEALEKSDAALIKKIYEIFYPQIEKWILNNSGTKTEAKDVFQEGLIALYKITQKENYKKTNFKSLLWTICKNKWFDALKSNNKGNEVIANVEEMRFVNEENAIGTLIRAEEINRFYSYFKKLDEKCQQLFKYQFENKPLKEIAKLLNYTYDFVRIKKGRCNKALLKMLKNDTIFDNYKKEHL